MRVTEADRSFKKTKDDQDEAGRKESQPGPRRPKGDPRSRGQIKEKTQKMNDKLADWYADCTIHRMAHGLTVVLGPPTKILRK